MASSRDALNEAIRLCIGMFGRPALSWDDFAKLTADSVVHDGL